MSRNRRSKCSGDPSGLHRYMRFLSPNNKPIWHCSDCSSHANYDAFISFNDARCYACGRIFKLSLPTLRRGEGDNVAILCGMPDCRVVSAEARREASLSALAEKYAKGIRDGWNKRHSEVDPSRSEPEQDFPTLAQLMKGDQS